MADMWSPLSIHDAIQAALASSPLPDGTKGALVIHGDYDRQTRQATFTAVLAQRVGEHWVLSEDVELHDAHWKAGVNVVASW
jgi:hypothetical protein